MLAAITARGPVSQIVTTGRSRGRSGQHERHQPIRDVAAAGDVAGVAVVLLAYVDDLGARRDEGVELVDRDRRRLLVPAAEHEPGDVEEGDRVEASDRALGLVQRFPRARRRAGSSRARSRPSSRSCCPRPGRRSHRADGPRDAPRPRARRAAARPSVARPAPRPGRGRPRTAPDSSPRSAQGSAAWARSTAAESAMNALTSEIWSDGLNRRSKPIVVDGFELIALPQSEPATCPGNTSTPSSSSSSR